MLNKRLSFWCRYHSRESLSSGGYTLIKFRRYISAASAAIFTVKYFSFGLKQLLQVLHNPIIQIYLKSVISINQTGSLCRLKHSFGRCEQKSNVNFMHRRQGKIENLPMHSAYNFLVGINYFVQFVNLLFNYSIDTTQSTTPSSTTKSSTLQSSTSTSTTIQFTTTQSTATEKSTTTPSTTTQSTTTQSTTSDQTTVSIPANSRND